MIKKRTSKTNLWMFSMSWKLVPLVAIFFTEPGLILLIRLQRTIPSLKTSSKL